MIGWVGRGGGGVVWYGIYSDITMKYNLIVKLIIYNVCNCTNLNIDIFIVFLNFYLGKEMKSNTTAEKGA